MTNDFKIEKKYIFSIVLHILLGGAVFALPFLTKVYSILLFLIGLFIIIKNQNKNHEALLFAGSVSYTHLDVYKRQAIYYAPSELFITQCQYM